MAHVAGTAVKAYWNTGTYATPSYTAIGGVVSDGIDWSMSPRMTTDKSSADYEECVGGIRSWTFSASILYDAGDTALTQIEDDLTANTLTKVQWKTLNSVVWSGDALLTSVSFKSDNADVVKLDITAKGTGALGHA